MKTLVKSKIVLQPDGKSLTIYLWKKQFLCFGYWYPWGCCTSIGEKISQDEIDSINDNEVSRVLFDNFISNNKKQKL